MSNYMMSGALPVPKDYKYTPYEPKDCVYDKPKPKFCKLFDRNKVSYISLVHFKNRNMGLLEKNEDLAMQYALLESCYTYVHEQEFQIHPAVKPDLLNRFKSHKEKFNGFFNITKFRL